MFNLSKSLKIEDGLSSKVVWRSKVTAPQSRAVTPPRNMQRALPPSAISQHGSKSESVQHLLFNNRANLKILVSQVAMHLEKLERDDIFLQLDYLLSENSWVDDSNLLNLKSMSCFLRFLIANGKLKRPSLNITDNENLMATWFGEDGMLSIEFCPDDLVILLISKKDGQSSRNLAYRGIFDLVEKSTAVFDANDWYRETTRLQT
jgi:hypothetical protein